MEKFEKSHGRARGASAKRLKKRIGWGLLCALAALALPFVALDALALFWLPLGDAWFWGLLAANWAVAGLASGLACVLDGRMDRWSRRRR